MIIRTYRDAVLVDTVHQTAPPFPAKFTLTRAIRSGPPSTTFPTPPAGAHFFHFTVQLEVGEAAVNVPISTGEIVAEAVKAV